MACLSTDAVAKRYGVSADTVRAWINAGLLRAINAASPEATRPKWTILESDLDRFERLRASTNRRRRSRPRATSSVSEADVEQLLK